jgi:stage II sporulation protein M
VLGTIAPHGVIELPALLLVAAAALRWQTSFIAPAGDRTISENWLAAAADFTRIFVGIVAPLLLLAALVEAFVTPYAVIAVYGAPYASARAGRPPSPVRACAPCAAPR